MYRIGEFSKLTNLSIRTLRYYNEIGLLVPEEVDIYTNYRYYGKRNIEEVKLIDELKKSGFTLEEIRDNWNNFQDDLFVKKKKELYEKMNDVEEQIKQLDQMRLKLSSKEKNIKIMEL